MDMHQIVLAMEIFLHDLFTVIWIGGLFTLGVIVLPAVKKVLEKGPQTKAFMGAIQKRLGLLVYLSMAGLIITGLQLAKHAPSFQGLFSFENQYAIFLSLKHLLVLAMVAAALFRSLFLNQARTLSVQSREKWSGLVLALNIILGIGVLLLSGFSAALG